MNSNAEIQKQQKQAQRHSRHWKRRRRRRQLLLGQFWQFWPSANSSGHQIPSILFFLASLLQFANIAFGMTIENCTLQREEGEKGGRSNLFLEADSTLKCPTLEAFGRFNAANLSPMQIGHLELKCDDGKAAEEMEGKARNAVGQIQKEFPVLRQISIQNCSSAFVHEFASGRLPSHLEMLNLSGNNELREFGWLRIGQNQLKALDLGRNELDCGNCANAWMIQLSGAGIGGDQNSADQQQQWPIRSLFPTIPERLILPSSIRGCQFAHCAKESARFDAESTAKLGNLRLGDSLEMKCQFRTENALPTGPVPGIFIWPLNNENEEIGGGNDGNNGTESKEEGKIPAFQTTLLPAENAALLRIAHLRSGHLGHVACRCVHCAVPTSQMVRLRFPVPLSVHIPSGHPPGERHLILHGFPLEGPIRMEITWKEENWTETQELQSEESDHSHQFGQQQQPIAAIQTRLLFNGSLAIRPEPDHAHFFLRYFSLSIHECAGCRHHQGGGTFRLRICVGNSQEAPRENASIGTGNCAELEHQMEPPVYAISQRKDFLGAELPSPSTFSFLHFLISIPPILLSLALLVLGGKMVWRLKQRMAIREKLKRRGRRASRNTQRTEETSIPLDTMSRSLSLSNYIQSQLHVPLIDSRELQLNERIGKGAFGEVYVAVWRRPLRTITIEEQNTDSLMSTPQQNEQNASNASNGPTASAANGVEKDTRKVAVKMLTSIQMDAEMDREAALLARLEHPNVLRMFGIAHWSGQIALVLELMNLGDLRNYLRNREPRCNNYAQFPPALLQTEMVDICIQICEGLYYLAQQQIVHRDLAARNCLVSGESDLHCCSAAFRPSICVKISDFGMSRRLYASAEYYRMQDKKTALPVRWMPPECLSSGKFTPQSDIWSFGVLLFEIFTFGGMPFAALSNGEVLTAVLGGMRPEVPEKCRPEFADLMRECWHRSAHKRISALEALQRLRQIQENGTASANGPII